ncbi:hypothetical protein BCT90_20410 [Vibrio lentus]|uniref:Uncharacterized protein n=1 Tax=Vibrio lentus TaxID=136468 RepID=A0A1B9QKD9_9VIBR|nr:hypothetical protein A6E08_14625 [Vibrio lentus]PME51466.1 hypothetical protein BCV34_09635 [Vibrio lentus]PME56740.1 hypothetical protein BCV30_18685 [Vibrio lentus]PME93980.1 hypothetical protein BCV27_20835 [Vibrio lentus]PMG69151.1 hypothetical protein BCU86_00800 [Vibrio lentus]
MLIISLTIEQIFVVFSINFIDPAMDKRNIQVLLILRLRGALAISEGKMRMAFGHILFSKLSARWLSIFSMSIKGVTLFNGFISY